MEKLKKEIDNVSQKVVEYLFNNLDNFEFKECDEHTASYLLEDLGIQIWVANGEDCCHFYGAFFTIKLENLELTGDQTEILWKKAKKDKSGQGEKRQIGMSQLSNDLFFSFNGVYDKVKFTGYDDNDWWTKYKPLEIKESDDIVWKIDLDKMIAIYKQK